MQYRLGGIGHAVIVVTLLSVCAGAQNWSGIIASGRAIDWSASGIPGGIPNRTRVCTTIQASTYGNGSSDASAAIQSAMNSCGSGVTQESGAGVVVLSAGTFLINTGLSIPSWVTLRGAGATQTILDGHNGGTATVRMGSSVPTTPTAGSSVSITAGATAGSTSITVSSASGISVGGYLMVTELNDSNYVTIQTQSQACTWCDNAMWSGTRVRGQIVEVTSVSGTTIGITPGLYSAYPNTPLATPFTASVKWAGVENLQVFANGSMNQAQMGSFTIDLGAYCWIKGVMGNYADGDHVEVYYSYRGEIRDSYFVQSRAHTSGNYEGDIFLVGKTSGFLVENNIVELTHSSIVLNWGAAGNVIAYNYTTGAYDTNYPTANDIEMALSHGAHEQFNLIEGNVSVNIEPDYFWGSSSYFTFYRNWVFGNTRYYPFADGTLTVSNPNPRKVINFASPRTPTQNIRGFDIPYPSTSNNLVGNVSGSAMITESKYTSGPSECPSCIVSPASRSYNGIFYGFVFDYNGPGSGGSGGGPMPVGTSYNTAFLHGNYDISTNSVIWDVHGTGSHTLPASFYRSSKPSWWGNTIPWPAVGPDVTGGTGPGGHTYSTTASNPAQACYNATAKDAYGLLQFDPTACYAGAQGVAQTPSCSPTSGTVPITVTCTNPNTGTTVICTSTSSTPVTNASGTDCTTGTKYTGSLSLSSITGLTLKAIAGTSTLPDSSVVSYTYTQPPPAVSLSTASLSFGNQITGSSSSSQSVTLTNTGTGQLAISSIILTTGTQFTISANTCGATLDPSNTCSVSVRFSPLTAGVKADSIRFTTNASTSPDTVTLSGTGVTSTCTNTFCESGESLATGESTEISTGGPPNYAQASRSTAPLGTLSPIFTASSPYNSTAHSPLNPTSNGITLINDKNIVEYGTTTHLDHWLGWGNLTHTGSANDRMCSKTTKYCAFVANSENYVFEFDLSGSFVQNVTNGNGNPSVHVPGSFEFTQPQSPYPEGTFYWETLTSVAGVNHYILRQGAINPGLPMTYTETNNANFPFDWANCPGVPAGAMRSASVVGVSLDDSVFTQTISWTGDQGTATHGYAYKPGTGCAAIDLSPSGASSTYANVYAYCASNCASATPIGTSTACYNTTAGTHASQILGNGKVLMAQGNCENLGTTGSGNYAFWEIATTNVIGVGPGTSSWGGGQMNMSGHESMGATHIAQTNNPNPYMRLMDPLSPTSFVTRTDFHSLPGSFAWHGSWPHPTGDDSYPWINYSFSNTGCGTNCATPQMGQNEIIGIPVDGGALIRFAPNYNSETSGSFACNQNIPSVSQDGRAAFFLSDELTALGLDSTGAAMCAIHAVKLE